MKTSDEDKLVVRKSNNETQRFRNAMQRAIRIKNKGKI